MVVKPDKVTYEYKQAVEFQHDGHWYTCKMGSKHWSFIPIGGHSKDIMTAEIPPCPAGFTDGTFNYADGSAGTSTKKVEPKASGGALTGATFLPGDFFIQSSKYHDFKPLYAPLWNSKVYDTTWFKGNSNTISFTTPTVSDEMYKILTGSATVAGTGQPLDTPVSLRLGLETMQSVYHMEHPSGKLIPLGFDDSVFVDPNEVGSYLIKRESGKVLKVSKTGTVKAATKAQTEKMGTQYVAYSPEPTMKVPGTKVTLRGGQSLWISTHNTLNFAVVEDGKVVLLVSKKNGKKKSNIGLNWQSAVDSGKAVCIATTKKVEVLKPPVKNVKGWDANTPGVGAPVKPDEVAKLPVGTQLAWIAKYGYHEVWTRVGDNAWTSDSVKVPKGDDAHILKWINHPDKDMHYFRHYNVKPAGQADHKFPVLTSITPGSPVTGEAMQLAPVDTVISINDSTGKLMDVCTKVDQYNWAQGSFSSGEGTHSTIVQFLENAEAKKRQLSFVHVPRLRYFPEVADPNFAVEKDSLSSLPVAPEGFAELGFNEIVLKSNDEALTSPVPTVVSYVGFRTTSLGAQAVNFYDFGYKKLDGFSGLHAFGYAMKDFLAAGWTPKYVGPTLEKKSIVTGVPMKLTTSNAATFFNTMNSDQFYSDFYKVLAKNYFSESMQQRVADIVATFAANKDALPKGATVTRAVSFFDTILDCFEVMNKALTLDPSGFEKYSKYIKESLEAANAVFGGGYPSSCAELLKNRLTTLLVGRNSIYQADGYDLFAPDMEDKLPAQLALKMPKVENYSIEERTAVFQTGMKIDGADLIRSYSMGLRGYDTAMDALNVERAESCYALLHWMTEQGVEFKHDSAETVSALIEQFFTTEITHPLLLANAVSGKNMVPFVNGATTPDAVSRAILRQNQMTGSLAERSRLKDVTLPQLQGLALMPGMNFAIYGYVMVRSGIDSNKGMSHILGAPLQTIYKAFVARAGQVEVPADMAYSYKGTDLLVLPGQAVWGVSKDLIYIQRDDTMCHALKGKMNLSSTPAFTMVNTPPGKLRALLFKALPSAVVSTTYEHADTEVYHQIMEQHASMGGWDDSLGTENIAAFTFRKALPAGSPYKKYASLIPDLSSGMKALMVRAAVDGQVEKFVDTYRYVLAENLLSIVKEPEYLTDKYPNIVSNVYGGYLADIASGDHNVNSFEAQTLKEFCLVLSKKYPGNKQAALDLITEIVKPYLFVEAPTLESTLNPVEDTANIVLSPVQHHFGGMHKKAAYTDQTGELWMSKFFASDPNAMARVDAEHYGNRIASLMRYAQPDTFVRSLNGQYCYVQHIDDAIGSLQGLKVSDLNDAQLASAMTHHVVDYGIGNHDSYSENLLLAPDKKTVIGIDKGQAFKHVHDDKLAVDYLPPENPVPVWYDQFYHAVLEREIDQARAEYVARVVLSKAYYYQRAHADRYEQMVRGAVKNRKGFPQSAPTADAFVALVMKRKAGIFDDFVKFYQKLWEDAGWKMGFDPTKMGAKVGNAHTQNGMDFIEDVMNSTALGVPLFFSGPTFDDCHLMVSNMKQKNGGLTLLVHGRVMPENNSAIIAWLNERLQGGLNTAVHDNDDDDVTEEVPVPENGSLTYPLLYETSKYAIAWAKTIATHAKDGGTSPDGAYNSDTVNAAKSMFKKLKDAYDDVCKHQDATPDKVYGSVTPSKYLLSAGDYPLGTFYNAFHQAEWLKAADTVLSYRKLLEGAQDSGKSFQKFTDVMIPKMPVVTKKTELPAYDPKAANEKWNIKEEAAKDKWAWAVKSPDGGHWIEWTTGVKMFIDSAEFATFAKSVYHEKVTDTPTDAKVAAVPEVIKLADLIAEQVGNTWRNPKHDDSYVKSEDGTWNVYIEGKHDGSVTSVELVNVINTTDPEDWINETVDETTVKVQISGRQFVVTHGKSVSHRGSMDPDTLNMKQKFDKDNSDGQTGNEYTVVYDNVIIRYRSWSNSGAMKAQYGYLNAEIRDWDESMTSFDELLEAFAFMGMNVNPADETSLEYFYWSHIVTDVMSDRKLSTAYAALYAQLQAVIASDKSEADKCKEMRKLWEAHVKDSIPDDVWTPKFMTYRGKLNGRPMWYRPDVSLDDYRKALNTGQLPVHFLNKTDDKNIKMLLSCGVLLSTEERFRLMGNVIGGMSPFADQGHGSSPYVFLRQNYEPSGDYGVVVDPRVAMIPSTYSFNGDHYGEISSRKSKSPFAVDEFGKFGYSSNEMCVKHFAPVLFVVCYYDATLKKVKKMLTDAGITEINGRSIDDVVISTNTYSTDKAWATVKDMK